ncbi:MAG: hypothetical protein ABMA01_18080, partial [Chthoniobacteraceae bacterium]
MKNVAFRALVLAVTLAGARAELPDPKPGGVDPRPLPSREAADVLNEDELRQVVDILRENYLRPDEIGETALARAGIQGLLDRLGAGARIYPAAAAPNSKPSPFRSEILEGNVGYLRLGTLAPENIMALDGGLETFAPKPPAAVVLDLRAT